MPVDPDAPAVVSALRNVPDFAHGLVRDLRVRWALEEIDRPYRAEIHEGMEPRPQAYREWQPFGQVPAFADCQVRLFESGAIILYLGEQDERLLPREPQARWTATSWLIAALNSVEPMIMQLVALDIFYAQQEWARAARPNVVASIEGRLKSVSDALGDTHWLAGAFSLADIMMVTVLRNLRHTDIVAGYPRLAAYQARGEARPAFLKALSAQKADLGPPIKLGEN